MKLRKLLIAGLGLAMVTGAAGAASATPWQAEHHAHRVAAIRASHRAVWANRKLSWDVRHGRVSRAEAYRIHAHLVRIRHHARHAAWQ